MEGNGLESTVYSITFVASFLILALLEGRFPSHGLHEAVGARWARHGILLAVGAVTQALVLRLSPVAAAWSVRDSSWGLLNRDFLPLALRVGLALLALDFVRYLTHRLFHAFSVLWRIHEVHHSDEDYDVSTSVRFHPLEVIGAKALYVAAVLVLAPPAIAVLIAEALTALLNAFTHANVRIPEVWERGLRWVFVTPAAHRIHHSLDMSDQNTNFGQTFLWWDRMFGTYREEARRDEGTGVEGIPATEGNGALALLTAPFRRRTF